MSSAKGERKLHKAVAMLMLTACVWGPMGMGIAQADVEDTVIVPNRVILIKKGDHQGERDLHIRGTGSAPIFIIGGEYNPASGAANTVDLNKPNSFVDIYGGYHDDERINVTNNIVNVDTGITGWLIYDDPQKLQDSEHYNKLKITSPNNKLAMNVIAGHARGEASGNVINLNGGALADYVIAAETQDYDDGTGSKVDDDAVSRLHDNTVNINANMELAAAKIYGAAVFHQSDRSRKPFMGTNNTLNTYVKDQQVGELGGFNTYNFYLPQGTKSGDTLVTVVGGKATVISASTVRGIVEKTGSLPFGSTVNLLVNASGVTAGDGTIYQGIHKDTGLSTGDINSRLYELVVYKADSSHVVLKVVALNRLHFSTKSIVQAKMPTLINRGADFLSGDAAQSADAAGAQVYTPFYALSYSDMRHTTGSYVDMRGTCMVVGMSKKTEKNGRRTLLAPVFEYGYGNYDACLDEGTCGQGNSRYYGIGFVFRNTFKDGSFYEGSLRGGRLNLDYSTNDYVYNGQKTHENFDSSTFYAGAHLGAGREVNWQPRHKITYYGKFFYTHTGAEDIRLSNGQLYQTSHVNSERLRLGIRDSYELDKKNKLYCGLAWEYEFDGSAYATYDGLRTETPQLRGSSYMLELGWVVKPKGNDHLSVDVSATGWLGRQRGITGRLGINWMF